MRYKLQDGTNDKKYFTIVPNYILNHSSAIDQALYFQMKRVAGEDGLCFMTQRTLCRRLGIGKDKLKTSLKYLLKHNWVTFVGTTESKTRPINTYKVNDIWKENTDFYQTKKISPKTALSSSLKDKTQKAGDKTQNSNMIRPRTDPIRITNNKEDKLRRSKYTSLKDITDSDVQDLAKQYEVSPVRIRSSLEDLTNYCQAHGRRYKNYLAALRNFVKKDTGSNGMVKKPKPKTVENFNMTPTEQVKAREKADEIRGNLSTIIRNKSV